MSEPTHTEQSLREAADNPYVKAFYWLSDEHDPRSYLGGASCFAVRSGAKLFGVTAEHAIREFERKTVIGTMARFGNHRIDPIERIIARSEHWDVATFELTPSDVNKMGIEPLRWPPLTPTEERGVAVIGFLLDPGRVEVIPNGLVFDRLSNLLVATRIFPDSIEVEIDANELERPAHWSSLTEIPRGFSGGPMLTVVEGAPMLRPFMLGGVVTNFLPTGSDRGHFRVVPAAACMLPDGSLVQGES